jgi:ribosomal protein S6--L-glutamate ligase
MRQIEKMLQEISNEENLTYQSLADSWILRVDGKFVAGYHFAINDAASSALCDDKSATYECLKSAGVPAVPHHFFMSMDKAMLAKIHSASGELVLKPNNASGGDDVVRVSTIPDIFGAAENILSKSVSLTVSPFIPFKNEYRVIMLDGEVLLMYRKQIQSGWKHNLGLGALPELIEQNEMLSFLATRTVSVLGIRFASVDIAETEDGMKILEVNSGVMMERFSELSEENYWTAKEIYRKAVLKQL